MGRANPRVNRGVLFFDGCNLSVRHHGCRSCSALWCLCPTEGMHVCMLASAAPPQFCSAPVDSHEPCVANRGAQEHTTGQQRSLQRKHLNRKQGHPNPDYPRLWACKTKGCLRVGGCWQNPKVKHRSPARMSGHRSEVQSSLELENR